MSQNATVTDPVFARLEEISERAVLIRRGWPDAAADVARLVALAWAVRGLVRDDDGTYLTPECYVPAGEFQAALIDALTGPADCMPEISDGPAPEYLKTWAEHWAPIICRPDGTLNFGQLARELADYWNLIGWTAEVYCHVTGDRISKPNTLPSAVISVADERTQELIDEEAGEAIDSLIEDLEGAERGPFATTAEVVTLIGELTGRKAAGA